MTMPRRQHRGEFHAQVVLEARRGARTIPEVAAEDGVHPIPMIPWKQVVWAG